MSAVTVLEAGAIVQDEESGCENGSGYGDGRGRLSGDGYGDLSGPGYGYGRGLLAGSGYRDGYGYGCVRDEETTR